MDFALIKEDSTVENVVVAEHIDIVRGLFPEFLVVEITENTGTPFIGEKFENGKFKYPSPFPSWIWNNGVWRAPVEIPSDGQAYSWNEDSQSWVVVVEEQFDQTDVSITPNPEISE